MGKFKSKFEELEMSLSFDDVLIKPALSDVRLAEVDLSLQLNEKLKLSIPIFSAAMDTVTGYETARAMIEAGACGTLHKNVSTEENIEIVKKLHDEFGSNRPIAVSVGVGNTKEEIGNLINAGANIIVVDSAHAHTNGIGDLVQLISTNFPDVFLIAGNIVTKEAAAFLIERGAHAVKVGIGPGSICTTRKVTGIGRGQVSSISEVADYCRDKGILVISDGGMKATDDIMKSFACGADAVMLGYMLAGCDECPAEKVNIDGEYCMLYRGMGSISAMKQGSAFRYGKSGLANTKWVAEGVESYVKCKGQIKDVLHNIEWSLKSAFGYVGAWNIKEAQEKTQIVRITNSVLNKSNFHSIDKLIK
ncbi:guanosine monophosphate reductase [Candidatus Mycoplasma haematohominis]|uniref:guanosine monophosphate reductase n=1 Tax=Candidatus Mycoplasma haematohominis TaxID=1494318 RepID=UPI001C0A6E02|nr:guanosine monophosphate reductase [Candidatus Mycoplasma haemohominis]